MGETRGLLREAIEKTYDWPSLQKYLYARPELLTYEADTELADITREIDKHGDSDLTRRCLMLRHILRQSREVGIEEAFHRVEATAPNMGDRLEKLSEIESEMTKAGSADGADGLKRILRAHPELMTQEGEMVVMDKCYTYQMIQPDDQEALNFLLLSRDVLCLSRILGIDKGVEAAHESFVVSRDMLLRLIPAFAFSEDMGTKRSIIESNPVLLTCRVDEGIEKMILRALQDGKRDIATALASSRDLLRLCRDRGIPEAFRLIGAS